MIAETGVAPVFTGNMMSGPLFNPAVTNPTAEGAGGGFLGTTAKLFKDPNFLQLLSGIGGALDPQGFAGALNQVNQQYLRDQAARKAFGNRSGQRNSMTQEAINALGGMTPKGQPGVTSMSMTPSGSLKLEVDPPGDQQAGTQPTQIQTGQGQQIPQGQQIRASDILPFY